jgi:hypothetical protein
MIYLMYIPYRNLSSGMIWAVVPPLDPYLLLVSAYELLTGIPQLSMHRYALNVTNISCPCFFSDPETMAQ